MLRILVLVLFSVVIAPPITAQAARSVAGNVQSKGNAAALPERISLAFENTPLSEALLTIARRSGIVVTFDDSKLPRKRVSYRAESVTPDVAFTAILNGTGLRAVRSGDGIEIVKAGSSTVGRTQGIITGKVTDAKSGKSISGANISIGTDTRGVATDNDGQYRLTGVTAGAYTVTVRLLGYAKQSRQVTVGEGATATADFKLEPSANVLDQVIVTGTVVQTELKAVPNAITVITAKQLEERGVTRIDQLFRGDIPGLFSQNLGSGAPLDEVTMFSRGTTALSISSQGVQLGVTNPIKTYLDGVELADSKYLSQIDPKSIERIEVLTGPQASTIYGSNAINGVMQIFTKRGTASHPQLSLGILSGFVQNNFRGALTPQHDYSAQLNGIEGKISYSAGGSWVYMGPWTPAKQLARTNGFGATRLDMHTPAGQVTADVTLRRGVTQNIVRGTDVQATTDFRENGWYTNFGGTGLTPPTTLTLVGQTLGLTVTYTPTSWWYHEVGVGQDDSDNERRWTGRTYQSISDTTLLINQTHSYRRSLRYTTTAQIPLNSLAHLTVIGGADNWQSLTSDVSVSPPNTLTGNLSNVNFISRQPSHNAGGFMQSQLGLKDRLFLTYGLRMEKNPTIGEKARVIPGRYGAAYTQELGTVTAKLRGSYGRSIRPPTATRKNAAPQTSASVITLYGNYNNSIANPDLTPEYQQGGEGGVELYFSTRGSLVVTRYNQTVNNLIDFVVGVDSVRSLAPCPDTGCSASSSFRDSEGYAFRYQRQYINLGSIRNQGWELQGNINLGPVTTRGTYSWTKSRVIGVTPKYRSYFSIDNGFTQYQPGGTFQYLPEHTWAIGTTYSRAGSNLGLNFTGIGRALINRNETYYTHLNSDIRLPQNRFSVTNSFTYVNFNNPYALVDLQASHRFNVKLEGVFQVQNVTDKYINDYFANLASLGRQIKFGFRIRTQ